MITKKILMISVIPLVALLAIFASWLPADAAQNTLYPAKLGTILSGKQGVVLSSIPNKVKYVAFDTVTPPLPARYLQGVEIAYRGPTVEISFLNNKQEAINYSGATAQVFFNISVPEKNMWDQGGTDALAIWHYNEDARQWEMSPTVLVAEKSNNGQYDRLAAFVFQNGIYMLGKMSFDPVFPLWFKPYNVGDPNNTGPVLLQSEFFSAKAGTFEFGKQGVVLNTVPDGVRYVSFFKVQPPLPPRFHQGVDIAYRGPVVDVTFMNVKKESVESGELNAQVYFNISTPEKKMWDEGGAQAISIWHYNSEDQKWESCPTYYVSEKLNNGKYDRLTCYTSQSGIYILGKMEFDPFFPEWFKPYDKGVFAN
ncbi:MAG TPA: hypothetical protein DEH22_01515 [Chloroflexi bacterium]|nr:hypothetical protein [Chloroflexota bacterium]